MKDLTDTVIQEHEDMVDNPDDPTDAELAEVDSETVDSILNFLDDLNFMETQLEDFQYEITQREESFRENSSS